MSGLAFYESSPIPQPASPQILQQAPSASPTGIRKFLTYNGYRYAFVDDGAPFKFTGTEPVKSLGTLVVDLNRETGKNTEDSDVEKDYAATFAVGGELYEIPAYPSHFRIAVRYEQNFYLAEIVAKVNDSAITAKDYLDMSNLKEHVQDIHILNHAGNDILKKMTDPVSVKSIIEGLYAAKTADLTNRDFKGIAEAQSQGKSYQLKFNLTDGTSMAMYIIPEFKIVSMGDAYYQLPDRFLDQSGDTFKNLKQDALPLY
ncbi:MULTISPECIES: hypothetical protein [unclassified Paenibacillus]|uniref:hypothetical protein n=1 Tax=unclassified Paenibacillus TaxID=185978 RepID=UPI00020D7136|nr:MULTISPECIES: hypothetical protein [unclassified Paenibacillus]EGL15123.1 hypothetical protein HMPREF9413_2267 [Paenibacillus sp. HGF7]EPD93535.1 hypothetical protein HMPREF1207_00101 [Paenibacillus sp. HGH0039]